MKLDPDAPTPADILKLMSSSENLPDKVGGGASDADRLAAHDDLVRIINEGGVRFQCIACDGDLPLTEGAACVCGGMVCPACRATEEEGVCTHERPAFLPES